VFRKSGVLRTVNGAAFWAFSSIPSSSYECPGNEVGFCIMQALVSNYEELKDGQNTNYQHQYTLSIITSHILFGPGASLSLINYARWLAHDSWERGSQAKWRNYRMGVLVHFHFGALKAQNRLRKSHYSLLKHLKMFYI
jgi:hypothetical protein